MGKQSPSILATNSKPFRIDFFSFLESFSKTKLKMLAIAFLAIVVLQLGGSAHGAAVKSDVPSPVRALDEKRADDPRSAGSSAESSAGSSDGWIMLQHRTVREGDEAFETAGWEDYKRGFAENGESTNAFWFGLEDMHRLTSSGRWRLLIKIRASRFPTHSYIMYDDFKVGPGELEFPLQVGSEVESRGWLSEYEDMPEKPFLEASNGWPFTTSDRDNDYVAYGNCAARHGGGWWFAEAPCSQICLNCNDAIINDFGQTDIFYETYMGMIQIEDEPQD